MATIDTIIRKEGGSYYAIVKDERYPTLEWSTGKTIRICRSPNLLGPYSEPGPPISPNFREAPTLIPSPNGRAWYLYYEQYPGVAYGLPVATRLQGPSVPGRTQPAAEVGQIPPPAQSPPRLDAAHPAGAVRRITRRVWNLASQVKRKAPARTSSSSP